MRKVVIGMSAGVLIVLLIISFAVVKKRSYEDISSTEPASLLIQAKQARAQGELLEAKRKFEQALENIHDLRKIEEIQKILEEMNMGILFSPVIDECSTEYVVKPRDNLVNIAKAHHTTVGLLMKSNKLTSNVIHPGQILKVIKCPFSLVIDKSQNLLFLKRKGEIIKTYVISTGENNSTPVGVFKIVIKLINPTWFKTGAVIPPDSPENILGTRWMGLDIEGYGIHGTREPEKLGQHVTSGCIRMSNEDVEELYGIVPMGTKVVIVD